LLAQWDLQGKAGLTEVLRHVPITVLLGTSGAGGAFRRSTSS
jgi:malate dehydrogenase (oxaloacetate-decarboxylating)